MRRLLSRTSVTIDEAVSILLGRTTGPIDFAPVVEAEDSEADRPVFCLRETLEDEFEIVHGEYRLAKHENQPAQVVAERLAAVERHSATMDQADAYRCAIDHELNKGEQSVLKVDSALSNTVYTFITLHSFHEWVKRRGSVLDGEQPGAEVPAVSSPVPVEDEKEKADRTRLLQQEQAILDELEKLGFDPTALPKHDPRKPSAKAAVHASLKKSSLFKGSTVFAKAWDRLRKDRRITDKAEPSSPQKVGGGDL